MSAPNGSAIVPRNQRVRLRYRIRAGFLSSGSFPEQAAQAITRAWQNNPQGVVLAPATAPVAGGLSLQAVGRDYFTSLDIKTAHALPSVTWDAYLQPWRRIAAGPLDFNGAELVTVDLLAVGQLSATTAPAQRATGNAAAAAASRTSSAALGQLVGTAGNRLLFGAGIVLAIVLAVQFGPLLVGKLKGR